MPRNRPRPIKRRLINAYFVSTLSITMVLFLVGLLGLMVINARYLNQYIREHIGLTLVLNEEVRDVDLMQLQKIITAQPEVKAASFVDSETAANELTAELGEDFTGFLGYNPLNATIDVTLFAAYTQNDSLTTLEQKFLNYPNVEEVYYQRNLVDVINKNSGKISFFLAGLAVIMLFMFGALINNTIRLSIYSKRFIIHTMQLVGATRAFIRRPIVGRSAIHGLLGACMANILLTLLIFSVYKEFGEIINYNITQLLMVVFALVFVAGLLISWLSTTFAVNKFLKMRYDELFY